MAELIDATAATVAANPKVVATDFGRVTRTTNQPNAANTNNVTTEIPAYAHTLIFKSRYHPSGVSSAVGSSSGCTSGCARNAGQIPSTMPSAGNVKAAVVCRLSQRHTWAGG